ncbi:ABC transporter permease [Streptomyces sp. NPDC020412]|uniref:ABC transporter permease n=1 Tax=Streptomyces sp. NPDC020412 TaxID=3365073 RepID=UPI0037A687D3
MPDALVRATTMAGRAIRISRRNVDAVITAMVLPVMLMIVFVYLFGGAIQTDAPEYITYVVPGVLVVCACFGAANTAVAVSDDVQGGIMDRFRSLDVGGGAVLAGHVAASVLRNLAATAVVLGVALLIGFRPDATAAGWLAALGLLVTFLVAISWFSAAIGLLARTPEAAGGFTFFMTFLPYPSSAFVPINSMPDWLHGFADHQPITPLIESLRALLLSQAAGSAPWTALAWSAGILAVSVAASGALFRARTK